MLPSLLTTNPSSARAEPKKTNSAKLVWVLLPHVWHCCTRWVRHSSLDVKWGAVPVWQKDVSFFIMTCGNINLHCLLFFSSQNPHGAVNLETQKGWCGFCRGPRHCRSLSGGNTRAHHQDGSDSFQVLTFTLSLKSISEEGWQPTASSSVVTLVTKWGGQSSASSALWELEIQHWHRN